MLVHFALDTDDLALRSLSQQPRIQSNSHAALIKLWDRRGVLHYDGQTYSSSRLKRAIDALPEKVRPMWKSAVKKLHKKRLLPSPGSWLGPTSKSLEVAKTGELSWLDLACLCPQCAIDLDLDPSKTSRVIPELGIAIAFLDSVAESCAFMHAETLADGEQISDVWDQRFRPVAEVSTRVTVIDAYALRRFLTNIESGRPTGLGGFLDSLAKTRAGFAVKLVSSLPHGRNHQEFEGPIDDLTRRFAPESLLTFEVLVVEDKSIGVESHERCVVFDEFAFEVGLGLELFEWTAAERRTLCHIVRRQKAHDCKCEGLRECAQLVGNCSPGGTGSGFAFAFVG